MITIKEAIKKSGYTRDYIMFLIKKNRISYATDGIVYIVDLDDILYQKEQVRLRKLTHNQLIKAKQDMLLAKVGVSTSERNKIKAIKVAKSTKRISVQ